MFLVSLFFFFYKKTPDFASTGQWNWAIIFNIFKILCKPFPWDNVTHVLLPYKNGNNYFQTHWNAWKFLLAYLDPLALLFRDDTILIARKFSLVRKINAAVELHIKTKKHVMSIVSDYIFLGTRATQQIHWSKWTISSRYI